MAISVYLCVCPLVIKCGEGNYKRRLSGQITYRWEHVHHHVWLAQGICDLWELWLGDDFGWLWHMLAFSGSTWLLNCLVHLSFLRWNQADRTWLNPMVYNMKPRLGAFLSFNCRLDACCLPWAYGHLAVTGCRWGIAGDLKTVMSMVKIVIKL